MKVFIFLLLILIAETNHFLFAQDLAMSELAFSDLAGKTVDWQEGADKKLFYFWATWCSECKAKMTKDLVSLSKRTDLNIFTVNIDKEIKRVEHFVKKNQLGLPVIVEKTKYLQNKFSIGAVPYWIVLKKIDNKWLIAGQATSYNVEVVNQALQ